jgi:hypothetical protein
VIFVVELPEPGEPRAWFSFDKEELAQRLLELQADGVERIVYWNEAEAVGAFEGGDPLIAGKAGWRARRALYQQLVALEVLADDC